MKINWSKCFDRIYCIHYLPQTRKKERLVGELERVGLSTSRIFTMRATDDNPYDKVLLQHYNVANMPNVTAFNLGREVLSIMNEALANGYGRILLIENDVAFLKDIDRINETLARMPDADIIQFDKFIVPNGTQHYQQSVEERGDGWFFDPQGDTYYSGACVAFSSKGMKYEKAFLTRVMMPPDSTFAQSGLKRAIAVTNLAIQVVYRNTFSSDLYGVNSHHDGYMRGGVDYSLYNVPEGYGYGSAL